MHHSNISLRTSQESPLKGNVISTVSYRLDRIAAVGADATLPYCRLTTIDLTAHSMTTPKADRARSAHAYDTRACLELLHRVGHARAQPVELRQTLEPIKGLHCNGKTLLKVHQAIQQSKVVWANASQ